MLIKDSAKKLQNLFFYVHNVDSKVDYVNLLPFVDELPHAKVKWGHQPKNPSREMLNICNRITKMTAREGLTRTDLIAIFIAHWVLPL